MIRTLLKPFSFLPALFLMYMIYSFSAQTGNNSAELSYKVSYKIVETADYVFEANMEPWETDYWAVRIHGATRKLAHMTIYFALAVAVAFPLYVYGVRGIWLMLLAGLICIGFACTDEYHQSFVAGRGPSKKDVAIDAFGVFWGIILVRIVGWTGRKTIFRPRRSHKKRQHTDYVQPYNPYPQSPRPHVNPTIPSGVSNTPQNYPQNHPESYHPYKDAIQPPYYHQ